MTRWMITLLLRLRTPAFVILTVLLGQPLGAGAALAWWNGDWPYRMKIDADAGAKGANVSDPIGRTQILLRLHSGNFNFSTVKEDGSDLRFIASDDKTPLHFHIARFDPLVNQIGLVWIDVPDLAPGASTPFYMYWGNAKATAGGDPRQSYDADTLLVYHFGDENGLPKDSTGYGNNALTGGKRDEAGIDGFALRVDPAKPVTLPPLAITAAQPMTWQVWVKPDDNLTTAAVYSLRDGANAVTIGFNNNVAYAQIESPSGVQRTSAGAPMSPAAWHLLTVQASDKLAIFVDGEPRGEVVASLPAFGPQSKSFLGGAVAVVAPVVTAPPPMPEPTTAAAKPAKPGTKTAAAPPPPPAPVVAAPVAPPPPNFSGLFAEFEIIKAVRPPGALKITMASEGASPSLLTFQPPEESSVFGTGYFGIIMKSVTPDAWVVIGILIVMFFISVLVMITKALFLGGLGRANRVFRDEFRGVLLNPDGAGDSGLGNITADKRPVLKRSSLYRLYDIGRSETDVRIATGKLTTDGLSGRSMAAIRSAVDAGLVRENQRLNRAMVLLTIAIAGGPFIGLLGTVVGVMITFAAIAAAGDVNVNAIAPGISAALLATVAGLTVAIPSLFGYNYFRTKISEAVAEMQVFVDELVTRIGEGVQGRQPAPGE